MKNWEQRFKTLSYLACAGTIAIAISTLLGIQKDWLELRQWFGEGPPMRANTALALLAAALSLILRTLVRPRALQKFSDRLGTFLAWIPLLIGVGTILQFALQLQTGLDELFYRDQDFPKGFPGRPSPDVSVNLVLVGLTLLLINRKEEWLQKTTRFLSLLILALPLVTLISSFFGADQLYSILPPHNQPVGASTNAALAFVLLSFALFFRRPDQGMAALFTRHTMGGIIARRHLTALVCFPFLVTFLSQFEKIFGGNDRPLSLAFAVLFALGGLVAFNWFTAKGLDRLDQLRMDDERKLKDQERLLNGVLDSVPVGIWIFDNTGKIQRGNPAGSKIWGGERYISVGNYGEYKGWRAHSGELIQSQDWALTRAVEKGETSIDETIIIQCFDGSKKVILNSATPVRDESGTIIGSIVTNYDISQRYRMEKHQALLAHAGEELIYMRDLQQAFHRLALMMTEGLCDCSLIYILDDNGALNLVSRASRDHVLARRFQPILDQYPPRTGSQYGIWGVLEKRRSIMISKVNEEIIQALAQSAAHASELREILHSYMLVPMITEEKTVGLLAFIGCDPMRHFDDIDLLAAEELSRLAALAIENERYAEKLKQAIQAREDVVAIVSHDLRSPLTVIMQSCDLITNHLTRLNAPENILRLVQLSKSASGRMHELISDLLDLSHLESGQFPLHCEAIDCLRFCRETVDLMVPLATQKGVTLSLDLVSDLPPAHADSTRLTQILNNLIGNAIKHTPSKGCINVHVRLRDDGWLEFTVRDTGTGIKADHLPLLFERYWKPYESKGGFGLGLYVVKGIIEAHGGSIEVSSEENKGTIFTFTIPSVLIAAPQKKSFAHEAAAPHSF